MKFNQLLKIFSIQTLLKSVAAASQEGADSEQILNSVYTVTLAQQKYIQDEYASLLVSSSFDAPTARFFKQLQKNTSTFTPEALSHLPAAATISPNRNPTNILAVVVTLGTTPREVVTGAKFRETCINALRAHHSSPELGPST